MDPLQTVTQIYGVARLIYQLVERVKGNKLQCKRLAERIKTIEQALQGLGSLPNTQQFQRGLTNLLTLLKTLQTFIEELTQANWFNRILRAGSHEASFIDYAERLKQAMDDLNLGLNAQQLINHQQDQQDQREDWAEFRAREEEILHVARDIHLQQHAQQLRQDQHQALIVQHLASLRLRFEQFPQRTPPNSDPLSNSFQVPFCDLTFEKVLKEEPLATVYRGRWHSQLVAIKVLKEGTSHPTSAAYAKWVREARVTIQLRSPSIVLLYAVCSEPTRYALVMEYMEQRSLAEVLGNRTFTLMEQQQLAQEIIRGLAFLHSQNILHRALNSKHVLLNADGHAKLSHFAWAKIPRTNIDTLPPERLVISRFQAPELLRSPEAYTAACDIYALGRVLWELGTGQRADSLAARQPDPQGLPLPLPSTLPLIYQRTLKACWQPDPHLRPTAAQLLQEWQTLDSPAPAPTGEMLCRQGLEEEIAGNHIKALAYYREAAAKNYARAKTNIGVFYLNGLGGLKINKPEAARWFRQGAEQGHARAMFTLGQILEHGDGVAQDKREALRWYLEAAAKQHPEAIQKVRALREEAPSAERTLQRHPY